jgi:uncharacterized membrane protein
LTNANDPRSVRIARRPIHPLLLPYPAACFIGALFTDIAYWRTAEMMWADVSAWLLAVGMILGLVTVIAGLIDLLRGRLTRGPQPVWPYLLGVLLVLVLSLVNTLIHTRDAWTSVVPWGLALSAIVGLILCATAWVGRGTVYRYGDVN